MIGLQQRRRTAQQNIIPASRAGWVQNSSLVEPIPYSAEVLDNFFPTAQGLRLRAGSLLHATIANPVVRLLPYRSGSLGKLWAASATDIYDVTTPADPEVSPAATVTGLTNGDWSWVHMGTSGGEFLVIANGADNVRHYNGTTWATPSITGVDSSTLNQVWSWGERLFFVEDGTLSAWYLPVNAVAGTASEFPLRSIFKKGGKLLFGANWSLDSGEGMDDVCIFVTDQGEVAVYEGIDPANADTFALVGVYEIAKPLSKVGHFKAGGDIGICTEDGIVSVSSAAQGDRTAMSRSALSYPIEDAWRQAVLLRNASHSFNSTVWHNEQILMVSVPDDYFGIDQTFIANVRTGAWCRYTGWDVQCSAVLDDQLYFGTSSSTIFKAERTGQDNTAPYTARWLPKYNNHAGLSTLRMARITSRGNLNLGAVLHGASGYSTELPPVPPTSTDENNAAWDVGKWGGFLWGGSQFLMNKTEWQSVAGNGRELSVWCSATSGRVSRPEIEVISMEYLFEEGKPL